MQLPSIVNVYKRSLDSLVILEFVRFQCFLNLNIFQEIINIICKFLLHIYDNTIRKKVFMILSFYEN